MNQAHPLQEMSRIGYSSGEEANQVSEQRERDWFIMDLRVTEGKP